MAKIRIKPRIRITPQGLIIFQMIFCMFSRLLTSMSPSLDKLTYMTHLIAVMLLWFLCRSKYTHEKTRYIRVEKILILITVIGALAGFTIVPIATYDVMTSVSISVYVKGCINYFRFYIFYLACITFLNVEHVKKMVHIIWVVFIINIFICLYEFFVLGCKMDFLGGSFGYIYGGNSGLNILLCVVTPIIVCDYIQKKISQKKLAFFVAVLLLIAAAGELKIFFIEFIVMTAFCMIMLKPNANTVKLILISIAFLILMVNLLDMLFPGSMETLLNPEDTTSYLTNGYVTGSLGRFSMFGQLEKLFYGKYPLTKYFGFGLGMFDATSSAPLAIHYSYLQVGWFGNATILLNSGYVGLISLYVFLICTLVRGFAAFLRDKTNTVLVMSISMTGIAIICMWYNATMSSASTGYLMYFLFAIPAIYTRERKTGKEKINDSDQGTVKGMSGVGKEALQA